MYKTRDRQNAFLALLLSVPAASIGAAMVLYPSSVTFRIKQLVNELNYPEE